MQPAAPAKKKPAKKPAAKKTMRNQPQPDENAPAGTQA
jgi:hypothetical protein